MDQLRAKLEALPGDLEAIYARILARIRQKSSDMCETAVMLQIASFTLRALTLRESIIVFKRSIGKQVSSDCLADTVFLESFRRRIFTKTGGLLEVSNGRYEQVKLIHKTVLAFLNTLSISIEVWINTGIPICIPSMLQPRNALTDLSAATSQPPCSISSHEYQNGTSGSVSGYSPPLQPTKAIVGFSSATGQPYYSASNAEIQKVIGISTSCRVGCRILTENERKATAKIRRAGACAQRRMMRINVCAHLLSFVFANDYSRT